MNNLDKTYLLLFLSKHLRLILHSILKFHLNAFLPVCGEKGFNMLMKEGRVYSHVEYPQSNLNRASCIATVATGTIPYDHGVIGDQWLDRKTLRPVYCVDDDKYDDSNCSVIGQSKLNALLSSKAAIIIARKIANNAST